MLSFVSMYCAKSLTIHNRQRWTWPRAAARLGRRRHRAAAGFTRDGTLEEIRAEVRAALQDA
jgi:hypothetical protein